MTGIETNLFLRSWIHRVRQLAHEIETVAATEVRPGPRQDQMDQAVAALRRVAETLDYAKSIPGDSHETRQLLQISVERYRDRVAQQRCQEIGGGVPLKLETPNTVNVRRFPKPSTCES